MPKNNSHEKTNQLDKHDSNNTKHQDFIATKLDQNMWCETHEDLGDKSKAKPPPTQRTTKSNVVAVWHIVASNILIETIHLISQDALLSKWALIVQMWNFSYQGRDKILLHPW